MPLQNFKTIGIVNFVMKPPCACITLFSTSSYVNIVFIFSPKYQMASRDSLARATLAERKIYWREALRERVVDAGVRQKLSPQLRAVEVTFTEPQIQYIQSLCAMIGDELWPFLESAVDVEHAVEQSGLQFGSGFELIQLPQFNTESDDWKKFANTVEQKFKKCGCVAVLFVQVLIIFFLVFK